MISFKNNKTDISNLGFSETGQVIEKDNSKIYFLLDEITAELKEAISKFPPFNSLHEAYAIILEELDELWDHVKIKPKNREFDKIRKECIQIAAMALRTIIDCGRDEFKK